ncbi:MAG TPA: LLM class flavin-dependent oxidoreductase [Pseudonocardia sp.]
MPAPVDLGILLPTSRTQWTASGSASVLRFASRAEELGYSSVWVNDSLLTPRLEALAVLAAVAATSQRLLLGTATLLPVLRRPVLAAQTLATIDHLSNGRLVLAVGAGFPGRFGEPVHHWSQVPWPKRFARLDETVDLWRRLWRQPDDQGSFHRTTMDFDTLPPALPPCRAGGPPVWLGGASDTALARAGRSYDGWLPYTTSAEGYGRGLAAVRAAAAAAGRPPSAVTAGFFASVIITDTLEQGRARMAEYAASVYGLTLEQLATIQAIAYGPAEVVGDKLSAYVRAGARHVVVRVAASDVVEQSAQMEALTSLRPSLERAAE